MHPDSLVGARHKPSPGRKSWVPGNAQRFPLAAHFPRALLLNFKFQIFNLKFILLRFNFEVTYPSGTILTEAPSIVETTHTKQSKPGWGPTRPLPM